MATTPADIPGIEQNISDEQKQADAIQGKLNSSPTALGGSGTPTASDISNQESLQRIQSTIQTLTDQKLRTQWYGTDKATNSNTEGEAPASKGVIGTTLDYLARPLYGVVGAVKHTIGQGSGSLYQDVADNMARNKNTFGDVLKSSGVPGAVSAPLGFALDIGMDPVNWLTMGSSALVPRLFEGAVEGFRSGEGIVEGLSAAARSGVMEKANTIGRFIPILNKTEAFAKFGESTLAATDAFQAITGGTAEKLVQEGGIVGLRNLGYHGSLMDIINKGADAIPGGQTFLKNFVYDPVEWVRQARLKDIFQEALGTGVDTREAVNAAIRGESIEPFMKKAAQEVGTKIASEPISAGAKIPFGINYDSDVAAVTNKEVDRAAAALAGSGIENKVTEAAPKIVNNVDDATSILKDPAPYISADPVENALRIANESLSGGMGGITLEDVAKIYNSGALDQTGVKWFDNMMNGIKDFTIKIDRNSNKALQVGKAVMDKYDQAMGIFRVAKVGASPTSWLNAVVGNMLMTHMATGSISPRFLGRLQQMFDVYRNKPGSAALLDSILMDAGGEGDVLRRGIYENATAARNTFGDIREIGNPAKGTLGASHYTAERILRHGIDAGVIPASMTAEEIAPKVQDAMADVMKFRDAELAKVSTGIQAGTAPTRKILASGEWSKIARSDIGSDMISQEMFSSSSTAKMFDHIAEQAKANPGNMAWKLLDFTFNKMSSGYASIDQTYKMATFLSATVDGYTLNELRSLRNLVDINPEELTKYASKVPGQTGQYLYRLSPKTAIELANVMYLNYSAMPAAIRVMRNFPLLGSPFISFMYGMALKTGQTLAYNPSAFNKVTFALNDFGGTKTPLEKKALNTSFYSYLNQPGMFRMPFFDKAPIYLNMTNLIPYYSMNMFNPTQTTSGGTVREQLVRAVQQSPILKDPVGSTLFDYLIQPLILGEAIRPQGQFGQPLYPVDANAWQKAAYGVRTMGEAYVPNVAAYAGLLTPQAMSDYIPSYRWRQISQAMVGKNQLGISSKEPAISRTVRTLLNASGVPVQAPVNTSFTQGTGATNP